MATKVRDPFFNRHKRKGLAMSIEERLRRLEKQMQFYKLSVVFLALVIIAGVSMGQTGRFNISDDWGKVKEENGVITCSRLMVQLQHL
jgi:hypothetical protein